jgi:hypothetical protein
MTTPFPSFLVKVATKPSKIKMESGDAFQKFKKRKSEPN